MKTLREIAEMHYASEPSNEFNKQYKENRINALEKLLTEQLRIHAVVGRSEQLICDTCKSGLIDYPDIHRRTCRCGGLGYNVTD